MNIPAEVLDDLTGEDMAELMSMHDVIVQEYPTPEEAALALLVHARERAASNAQTRNVPTPKNIVEASPWAADFDGHVYRILTICTTSEGRDPWAHWAAFQHAPNGDLSDFAYTIEFCETDDAAEVLRFADDLAKLVSDAKGWQPEW
ncbi:hypothetical protein HT102_03345 [Hoyosella sp. G463]|uniref:Uncharacterized protein n=1 Tax=Lolliginicoccus lacisalsi TaxID=2742202 RepID=A0A927JA63_9ACTN|nr:hypothetical protein [Lolliginicoccus lacisalsi]MBD8505526.1 hypothetical protein [Lolliginicoccus lacisalsi]